MNFNEIVSAYFVAIVIGAMIGMSLALIRSAMPKTRYIAKEHHYR
jgi:hypothetical protein